MYGSPVKCKKKRIFLERYLLIDLRLGGKVSKEEFQTKKQKLKDCQYEISQIIKAEFTDTTTTYNSCL